MAQGASAAGLLCDPSIPDLVCQSGNSRVVWGVVFDASSIVGRVYIETVGYSNDRFDCISKEEALMLDSVLCTLYGVLYLE